MIHPQLQKKIDYSIDLLRKAESLALRYSDEGFYLGFSGGKDSQALYHIAQLAGVRFKAYFSPTSIDPPEVIRFIRRQYPDVTFEPLKQSIYAAAIKKGLLPTQRVRWCCAEFKETGGAGRVVLVGVRHEESAKRATRNEVEVSGKKFSGNLDEFDSFSRAAIEKKRRRLKKKRDTQFDQFSEHEEYMITCLGGKDKIIISPIIHWTTRDVWDFLNTVVRVPHCSLYDNGNYRIGCILCPMSNIHSKNKDIIRYPHVKKKWIDTIKRIRASRLQGKAISNAGYMLAEPGHWNPIYKNRVFMPDELDAVEEDVAENIFDWRISGEAYSTWYAKRFLQQKLDL